MRAFVVVLFFLSASIGAQSARELLRQAKTEYAAGRSAEAQALLRSALALAEDADDQAAVYAACRSLIAIHDADDRRDLAAPLWERIVEILKRDPARDERDGGAAHEAWIGALREAGRDGDIGRAAASGAAWAKRYPQSGGAAAFRFAVAGARAAIATRRFDDADALIDTAKKLVEGLPKPIDVGDRMLVDGLAARLSLVEGKAAEALAKAEVAIRGAPERPTEAAIVRALALLGLGRLDEAVAAADLFSDERVRAVVGGAPFVEGCLEAARIQFECGRLDKAIVALDRAQAVVDRDPAMPFALRRATVAQMVGALTGLGRPEEALARLEAAGPVIERLSAPRSIGDYILLRQMVTARLAAGQYASARASAEIATAFATDRFGRGRAETADALALLAVCRHQGGELPHATLLYDEALSIARQAEPGGGRLTAVILGNLAGALRAGDKLDDAVARYDEALAMACDAAPGEIPNLAAKYGRLLLNEKKDAKAARRVFEAAIDALETLHERALGLSEADRGSFLDAANRFRAYDGLAQAHAALGEFESAILALERGRGRMLLDLVGRLRFDPLANVLARAQSSGDGGLAEAARRVESRRAEAARELEAAQSALDNMRMPGAPAEAGDHQKAAARLREAYASSRAAVREAAALTAREVEIGATADIASIRRRIEKGDRILWYSITDFDAWVFAIGKHPRDAVGFRLTDLAKAPVTKASLRAEVARYRRFLSRAPDADIGASVAAGTAIGAALADILLPPELRSALAGASTVYLVPHDALNDLVFETLPLPDANGGRTPWIDLLPPISYVPSGSVLNWLLGRDRARLGTEPQYRKKKGWSYNRLARLGSRGPSNNLRGHRGC